MQTESGIRSQQGGNVKAAIAINKNTEVPSQDKHGHTAGRLSK